MSSRREELNARKHAATQEYWRKLFEYQRGIERTQQAGRFVGHSPLPAPPDADDDPDDEFDMDNWGQGKDE